MRKLPQLNSLRTFESAARWLSFSKAAEELHVTPAAVSQQIRQLEAYLGGHPVSSNDPGGQAYRGGEGSAAFDDGGF